MKTHWKKLTNPNYLGAYDFEVGEKRTVQIVSVSQELVKGADGSDEKCIVAKLADSKPIILNKTNCKIISKLTGSPHIEDWAGKRITLIVAKVRAFGETVDALRVEPKAPELPDLNPAHPKWEGAKAALAAGRVTIEQIKSNYKLSKKHEDELIKP